MNILKLVLLFLVFNSFASECPIKPFLFVRLPRLKLKTEFYHKPLPEPQELSLSAIAFLWSKDEIDHKAHQYLEDEMFEDEAEQGGSLRNCLSNLSMGSLQVNWIHLLRLTNGNMVDGGSSTIQNEAVLKEKMENYQKCRDSWFGQIEAHVKERRLKSEH